MQYATVRHAAPAPLYGPPARTRRNTLEPNGRQNQNMIQLVKESQRQQYAHEYIDDRSSFVRAQKAEGESDVSRPGRVLTWKSTEERIQQDMERAMRAQRRDRARKFARASKAAEQRVQSTPVDDWRHGGNVRRPSIVVHAPQPTVGMTERVERGGSLPHPRARPITASFGPSQTSSHREAMSSVMEDSGIGLFSDEYDLYPRILQDVQRALKLKARREARLKSADSSPSSKRSQKSEPASSSSQPSTSPVRPIFPSVPFPPPPVPGIRESEPSTPDNNVPRCRASRPAQEDDRSERRWTMSITKRKDKEKHPSNSTVETRESMYAVARWFGKQEGIVISSLDEAEPLTWLKVAEKPPKSTARNPWHLSALIMEEYLRANSNSQAAHERIASLNSSPSLSFSARPPFPSSQDSSYFNLGPSLTRKLSYEGRISFEPRSDGRRSIESRKSGESGYSSIFSGSSLPHVVVPATSANNLHRRVPSDNGSSRNSLSEHSDDAARRSRPINVPPPLNRDSLTSTTLKASRLGVISDQPSLTPIPDDRSERRNGPSASVDRLSADLPPTAVGRTFDRRKVLMSAPPGEEFRLQLEQKRQKEADEEQANREYELKQHLLDATVAQNNRVRQLLNHISGSVREYDQAQSSLSTSLNMPYNGLPRELVDAFSHDPAAVTGATRSYKGWRAVDDIHHRLARQRETFRDFLAQAPTVDRTSAPESVLGDPISSLMESLKTLDSERQEIAWRALEVSDVLRKVQTVHTEVKAAYNGTLSHTSVVYPEISAIVVLEESYKNNYQYFWEVAMDVMTFLLDTVAPFWRTYGKRVGTDVQDFLIIPLYRNDIDTFPRRSFRHWIGLIVFFLCTVALTVFQTQAAVSSVQNFWLSGIPYPYIRRLILLPFWVSILLQWWAVVAELSIVLTQMAVVVWWAGLVC
ncbi:hypothetical protein DFH06DRAFT_1270599 [Mycena polygramma]|nr:hypothetical protein DFH06DRAFT_1270599 [Mycena polygramma]